MRASLVAMNSLAKQNFDFFIYKLMFLWLGVDVFLSVIRLVAPFIGVNQNMFGLLSNLATSVFMLLAFTSLIMSKVIHLYSLRVILVLCLVLIYGTFRGLISQGEIDQYAFKHIYMVGFATVFILFGRECQHLITKIIYFKGVYRAVFF